MMIYHLIPYLLSFISQNIILAGYLRKKPVKASMHLLNAVKLTKAQLI